MLGVGVGRPGHGQGQDEVLGQPGGLEAQPIGRFGSLGQSGGATPTSRRTSRWSPRHGGQASGWRTARLGRLREERLVDAFPHTPMPEHGLPRDEVMRRLLAMKQDDQDWRGGRVFSLVYSAGDDVHELLADMLALFSAENSLNVLAFPSIGIMQHNIVCNTATLLGADDPAWVAPSRAICAWAAPRACCWRSRRRGRRSGAGIARPGMVAGDERACGVQKGGRLLRRRPDPGAGGRRLPRRRRAGR